MRGDTKITLKIGTSLLLLAVSGLALYIFLFLSWASQPNSRGQLEALLMLAASVAAFLASFGVWLLPMLSKKWRTLVRDEPKA